MKKARLNFWISMIGLVAGLAGVVLHIFGWHPYAAMLVVGGFTFFAALYSIRFAQKAPFRPLDFAKLAVAIFVPAGLAFLVLSDILLLRTFFPALGLVSYAVFYFMGGLDEEAAEDADKSEKPQLREILSKAVLAIGIVLVFAGGVFKVMHWRDASPVIIAGLLLGAAWFVADTFRKEK